MALMIEFMGLLGSGKSTIARALAQRLHERGRRCQMLPRIDDWIACNRQRLARHAPARAALERVKPLAIGLHAATCPGLYAQALALVAACRPLHPAARLHRATRLLGWARQTHGLEQHDGHDLLLLDEGIMHHLWPIVMYDGTVREQALAATARRLALDPPRLIVHVRAEPDTALARLRERAGLGPDDPVRLFRFHDASADHARQIMHRLAWCDEVAGAAVRRATPGRLIELDAAAEPAANADRLTPLVEQALDGC